MGENRSRKTCWSISVAASAVLIVLVGLGAPAMAQVDEAEDKDKIADVTGDGFINILDLSAMGSRFGLQAGQKGYRGGLDLVPDGAIGMPDFMEVLSRFGNTAQTVGTMFRGRVFDGLGNPLQGVNVLVGNTEVGCTDQSGAYALPIGASDFGENLVTFVGPTFDPVSGAPTNSCDASAADPTPDILSGQYPTIPNKPVYINAGIDNVFRDIPLPERDLVNSQDLSQSGLATNVGGNAWQLNKKVEVKNAGVKLGVPAGCTATFPAGEDPVLSITRVPPDRLPVPCTLAPIFSRTS